MFDHQLFSYQRYGGASKYFAMLLKYLPRDVWDTTTLISNNEYVRANHLFKTIPFLPETEFPGKRRLMLDAGKPYSYMKLLRHNYDVFHQTHFEPYCLNAIGKKPMVTTFHDINFSKYTPNPKIEEYQRRSLSRADKIVAISQHTKKDLIEYFSIQPEKIEVIYHGIEIPGGTDNSIPFDFPYVLFVGARGKHKNFNLFASAFAELHLLFPEIRLICTRGPFTQEEEIMLNQYGIRDVTKVINADEQTMNALYRHALMFVFPSLYEGFGMPILEAMANGCPTILADASCFPEIAGDAALYFNPIEKEDILSKMKLLVEDTQLRNNLIDRGNSRVKKFSWEECARKHMDVYHSLC